MSIAENSLADDNDAQTDPPSHYRHGASDHILQFFASSHLPTEPVDLRSVSRPFGDMAARIVETIPRNPERTMALRKLLEAKDAAVRAVIAES